MESQFDTETRALLQRCGPEKLAPPDTFSFTLLLLEVREKVDHRLCAAVERVRTKGDAARILLAPPPTVLKAGLTYADALLSQFDLACCNAVSVFIADEVALYASDAYLAGLYSDLLASPEFAVVRVRLHSVPFTQQGRQFLEHFVGRASIQLPVELEMMRKKARVMRDRLQQIGGVLTSIGQVPA